MIWLGTWGSCHTWRHRGLLTITMPPAQLYSCSSSWFFSAPPSPQVSTWGSWRVIEKCPQCNITIHFQVWHRKSANRWVEMCFSVVSSTSLWKQYRHTLNSQAGGNAGTINSPYLPLVEHWDGKNLQAEELPPHLFASMPFCPYFCSLIKSPV